MDQAEVTAIRQQAVAEFWLGIEPKLLEVRSMVAAAPRKAAARERIAWLKALRTHCCRDHEPGTDPDGCLGCTIAAAAS